LGYAGGFATAPGTETLRKQIADLQTQLQQKDSQIQTLQGQITQKDTEIQNLQNQITELEALLGPIKKGAWNLIITFEGASGVTTDYFYVGGTDLRFNWTWTSTTPDYAVFTITLYKEGETIYTEMYFDLQSEGTTYAHNIAAAYYYLDISAANIDSWTVTVEQWIPES
jgi:hypothetical protein